MSVGYHCLPAQIIDVGVFSEEDAGILHKHTDFRDLRAHVARNRKLVISSICTVANYEVSLRLWLIIRLVLALVLSMASTSTSAWMVLLNWKSRQPVSSTSTLLPAAKQKIPTMKLKLLPVLLLNIIST